jgi:exocyst complex component 2
MLLFSGLTICGHNCLLTAEWMSASKIVCRVGQAKNDKGDIIVTTKSGGKGTSTVSFKLLKPEKIGKTLNDFILRKKIKIVCF